MPNEQLIAYIKDQESKGCTPEQLHEFLLQKGYKEEEIAEALKVADNSMTKTPDSKPITNQSEPIKKKSGKMTIIVIGVVILAAIISSAIMYLAKPVCGNGELEKNETAETCCADAGCIGEQSCEENMCVEPTCGECQFLNEETHICTDYSCCDDAACDEGEENILYTCKNPKTKESECSVATKIELSETNTRFNMVAKEAVYFEINDEKHRFEVIEVMEDSISSAIYSEPQSLTLKIEESKKIDVDGDKANDILITLEKIEESRAYFKAISFEMANKLNIEILPSKSVYEMGEKLNGEIKLNYQGKEFEAIALFTQSREESDEKETKINQGSINSLKIELAEEEIFDEEGAYSYSVSIYNCESIEKSCAEITAEDLINAIPIKTISTSITVEGGKIPIAEEETEGKGCDSSNECETPCENCKKETQICNKKANICADCFLNIHCESGFKCEEGVCAEEKATSEEDKTSEEEVTSEEKATSEEDEKNIE